MAEAPPDAARIASEARDRVRFEEEALALSDQVFRVARHLASSRDEADDLVQETYARAFRSWRSFTPGTNLRAWLLRILTNLNIDRGRRRSRRTTITCTTSWRKRTGARTKSEWSSVCRRTTSCRLCRQYRTISA